MPYADPKADAECKRNWYVKNRERLLAYHRAYREKHREKRRAYARRYYQEFTKGQA